MNNRTNEKGSIKVMKSVQKPETKHGMEEGGDMKTDFGHTCVACNRTKSC